jgi:hypothetical protein
MEKPRRWVVQAVMSGFAKMGEISRRLHGRLKILSSGALFPHAGKGARPSSEADVAKWIAKGIDPVHAVYLFVHHIASVFAKSVLRFPELRAHAKELARAENRYVPDGPPLSPLTPMFFQSWALFDRQIGRTTDTLASCLTDARDVVRIDPDQFDALRKMSDSRMGIYEHQGQVENFVKLRELISSREFVTHVPSGYRGTSGELWYVRLLPPLLPDLATYHVAFTTPYVLIGASRRDWIQFLKRNLVSMKVSGEDEALRRFLKFGSAKNAWNEFVHLSYHHGLSSAIFLSGIPDLKDTLPRS